MFKLDDEHEGHDEQSLHKSQAKSVHSLLQSDEFKDKYEELEQIGEGGAAVVKKVK